MTQQLAGNLYIFAAPSGAGKTSLVKALLEAAAGIRVSISHTTRAMRPGEEDGVHYHFVDVAKFNKMVESGEFLEHARVFDNYYGTARQSLLDQLNSGTDVILEIDWQGARQVRRQFPQSIGVFILPPSCHALRQRLQGRGQDSDEIIARRMRDAVAEMEHFSEFDYIVVNDDFDQASQELQAIVQVQRLRLQQQNIRLQPLLDELLSGSV